MISRSWFGAKIPKRAGGSRFLGLFPPMFRPEAPPKAAARSRPESDAGGELGWTIGLCRGHDLPPMRLSIVPQAGERMALRFDCGCRAAELAETPNEGC